MRFWMQVIIAFAGALLTLGWPPDSKAETYRCGNVYTDKAAPGCKQVADRVSVVPSAHAQNVTEHEYWMRHKPLPPVIIEVAPQIDTESDDAQDK